ncbi:trypsin-like peptidase domain-containing protein [Alkalihalobacillus macyae]|uniref:trypsin-like peptidase domain-containing protein n=1 Tax=Guptibacillus hwajinpoensis TaxID=208199 RepID=UPI00273C82B7|nr:trypsin-like peptidase domain-containing protein [Alkalihalobacillus macyae]MDP4553576.1 trypsin-like peptidase domain-containing protein [Alkalihalobacillus macyae]
MVNHNEGKYQKLSAEILQTLLKIYVCPVITVFWDEDKKEQAITAGTGVLLNLNEKFVVTNKHVIDAYRNKKKKGEEAIFQVGAAVINLEDAIIDENETLDLATIRVSLEQLKTISETSYKEFFNPIDWPAKTKISNGDVITIIGFPKVYRQTVSPTSSQFNSATATLPVMDANDKPLYVEIDLEKTEQIFGDDDPDKLLESLGGLSGGGVFFSNYDKLELIGIIKEDGAALFTGIQGSYSDLINRDGTISTQYDLLK